MGIMVYILTMGGNAGVISSTIGFVAAGIHAFLRHAPSCVHHPKHEGIGFDVGLISLGTGQHRQTLLQRVGKSGLCLAWDSGVRAQ